MYFVPSVWKILNTHSKARTSVAWADIECNVAQGEKGAKQTDKESGAFYVVTSLRVDELLTFQLLISSKLSTYVLVWFKETTGEDFWLLAENGIKEKRWKMTELKFCKEVLCPGCNVRPYLTYKNEM